MSELPGMWDESDLRGGEADNCETANGVEYWRARCLNAEDTNAALKARIAELESERDDLKADLYEAQNGQ